MASLLDINLDDRQISTSHRLQAFQNSNTSRPIQTKTVNVTHPPIIARYAKRDIRNSFFFTKKRLLKGCSSKLVSTFGNSNTTLRENLTPYRKNLYLTAKEAKQLLNFKYLWSTQGQICLRRDSNSRVININSFSDLSRLFKTK